MPTAKKADPELWKQIVAKVKRSSKYGESNSWNARKAQHAVKLYKDAGGTYIGAKSPSNSLTKWTKQDWQYSSEDKKDGRYLPKKVWDKLTSAEKSATNKKKKTAVKKGQKKASYSKKVARLVKNA